MGETGHAKRGTSTALHGQTHLLRNGETDALALGEGHKGLLARANDKHVRQTGGKLVADRVLDVDNVDGTHVLLCGRKEDRGRAADA